MKRLAIALLSCSLLTLAACGDDEDEQESEALTRAEFVKQANAVCAASSKEFKQVIKRDRIKTRADTVAFLGGAGHDILLRTYQRIDALVPPPELEDDVEAMVEAGESALATLAENPQAALRSGDLFATANAKATELGLKKCA